MELADKRQRVNDDSDYGSENEDESEDYCYVCGTSEDWEHLMICDGCDFKVCHSYCAGFD